MFLFAAFQIGKHEKKYFQSIGKQKLIKTHMRTPDHHRTPIVTNNKKTHSKRKNVVHSLKIKFSLNRDGRTDENTFIYGYLPYDQTWSGQTECNSYVYIKQMFIFVLQEPLEVGVCSTRIYSLSRLEVLESALSIVASTHFKSLHK